MHDIICPNCGESFLARDVAFDFSKYALPLIKYDQSGMDILNRAEFNFKFFVDEEDMIVMGRASTSDVQLVTDNEISPGYDYQKYHPLELSNKVVFAYIAGKLGFSVDKLTKIIKSISKEKLIAEDEDRAPRYDSEAIDVVKRFRNKYTNTTQDFDITADVPRCIIDMLCHICESQSESITIQAKLYCSDKYTKRMDGNKVLEHNVPDAVHVLDDEGKYDKMKKCCRYCNHSFPDEFGHYKMIPVTMLGSANSGKTSFMLALLYSTTHKAPFNQPGDHFTIKPLTNDDDYEAFKKQIDKYERGVPPSKT